MKKYNSPEIYIVDLKDHVMGPVGDFDTFMVSEYNEDDIQLGNVYLLDDEDEDDVIDPWAAARRINVWGDDDEF